MIIIMIIIIIIIINSGQVMIIIIINSGQVRRWVKHPQLLSDDPAVSSSLQVRGELWLCQTR